MRPSLQVSLVQGMTEIDLRPLRHEADVQRHQSFAQPCIRAATVPTRTSQLASVKGGGKVCARLSCLLA